MVRAQTRRFWQAFTPKLIIVWREGQLARLHGAGDVLAGLTVAIVALPLAMALGIASGATPMAGIAHRGRGWLADFAAGWIAGADRRPYRRVRGDRCGRHRGAWLCRIGAGYAAGRLFMLIVAGYAGHRQADPIHTDAGDHRFYRRHSGDHRFQPGR